MKTKHTIIILAIGYLLGLLGVGGLFKVMHWPFANIILIASIILKVFGGIFLVYKLITNPKFKEFMNW